VTLADVAGKHHEFHFRTHLFSTGVALDAFEIREGHPAGYQFKVIDGSEESRVSPQLANVARRSGIVDWPIRTAEQVNEGEPIVGVIPALRVRKITKQAGYIREHTVSVL
jgi:hypothetical protein